VQAAAKRVGGAALAIVVNNARITGRSYPIWELSDQDWHDVIAARPDH